MDWPSNTSVVVICILVGQQSSTFFNHLVVVFGLCVLKGCKYEGPVYAGGDWDLNCVLTYFYVTPKVEVHLHSVLRTEPEPIIGDCCNAFVRFTSVRSTSYVSPLNMLLGCAQYRSFDVTLLSVVILSVGHFNCTVCLKKVPVLKQVSVQHWSTDDTRLIWSRVVFQWACKTKPPFLCKLWLAVVFMKVIMFVHWLYCFMQVIMPVPETCDLFL